MSDDKQTVKFASANDMVAAFDALYLPGEEHKYGMSQYPDEDMILSVFTRGRWWKFEIDRAHEDFAAELRKAKDYIVSNAPLTTMYGA